MSESEALEFRRMSEAPLRARPDSQADPAGETGWYLERERRRRGLSHADVCDATGIHPHHLAALELGDLTSLPSRTETLHLLGVYAGHLGFDPAPLLRHYSGILPRPGIINRSQKGQPPKPFSSAKIIPFWAAFKLPPISRTGGAIASSLAAILLFGAVAWYAAPTPVPGAGTAAGVDPAQTATIDAPAPDASKVSVTETALAPQTGDGAADDMTAFISRQLSDPAAAKATAPSRVVLTAQGEVWLRVVDADGSVIMNGILKSGDRYAVPELKGVSVIARDGGLVTYSIDGKDQGRLGEPGEILVGKPITAAALMDSKG